MRGWPHNDCRSIPREETWPCCFTSPWELGLHEPLDRLSVQAFPFLAEPTGFSGRELMNSPEAEAQFVGAWGFLTLFAVNFLFLGLVLGLA